MSEVTVRANLLLEEAAKGARDDIVGTCAGEGLRDVLRAPSASSAHYVQQRDDVHRQTVEVLFGKRDEAADDLAYG